MVWTRSRVYRAQLLIKSASDRHGFVCRRTKHLGNLLAQRGDILAASLNKGPVTSSAGEIHSGLERQDSVHRKSISSRLSLVTSLIQKELCLFMGMMVLQTFV